MSELQIKNDVETQGDFIRFLIKEVENAAFTDIEDVVPFVKWLDDELSYLVIPLAISVCQSYPAWFDVTNTFGCNQIVLTL